MDKIILLVFWTILIYLLRRDVILNREVSKSIWVSIVWLFVIGSRSVSAWMNLKSPIIVGDYSEMTQAGNPFERNFFTVLIIIGLVILSKRTDKVKESLGRNKLFLVFMTFCLVSLLWSDYPFVGLKRLIRAVGLIIMTIIIVTEDNPQRAIACVFRRTLYGLVLTSVLFVRYMPQYGRFYNRWTYEVGYCGVCSEKNALGALAMIGGIFFLWDLISNKNREKLKFNSIDMWITIVLLLSSIYILSIADSSTSTFCFIIGMIVLLFAHLPSMKAAPQRIGVIILIVGGVLLFLQLTFDIKSIVIVALGRRPDLTDRLPLWNKLLSMVTNPILGAGYESFWTIDRMSLLWSQGFTANQAHNGYIDMYLNLGAIGLLFFLMFIVNSYYRASKEMVLAYDMGQFKLLYAIVFVFYNYTEAVFPRPTFLSFIFFLLYFYDDPRNRIDLNRQGNFSIEAP